MVFLSGLKELLLDTYRKIETYTKTEVDTLIGSAGGGAETAAKTVYIATTGSDTIGDGSSGSPYFSLHKAVSEIKEHIQGVEVVISAADGNYDFSALGDLIINKQVIKGSIFSGKLRIKPTAALADRFTVLDSGTFDSQIDTASNVHTCTGKTWTPNAYTGKFIRIITMNSGAMPSNGDGVNYTMRVIPIVRNGADWIETGYIYNSGLIQNIGQFEIVDPKVVFDLGANNMYITDDVYGGYVFNSIKITTTGHIMMSESGTSFAADNPFQLITYNSSYIADFLYTKFMVASVCYLEGSGSMEIGITDGCVLHTKYVFNYGKITLHDYQRNAVFYNSSGNTTGPLIYISAYAEMAEFVWKAKFINSDIAVESSISLDLSATFTFDTVNWFLNLTSKDNARLTGSSTYFGFANEPTEGRLTYDAGVNPATVFHDLNKNFNASILAPSVIDVSSASQLVNDSSIAGTKIKDALERLPVITLPISSFSGLAKITVSSVEPVSPGEGDIWVDTNADYSIKTDDYTLTNDDCKVIGNKGTALAITLPNASASLIGKEFEVKNIGAGDITLSGDVNINGSASLTITQWNSNKVKLIETSPATYLWITI